MYCERIAPGETERTCRGRGRGRSLRKRSRTRTPGGSTSGPTKKYYARYMKETMSKDVFKTWAEQAAADRDTAIAQIEAAADAAEKAQITEWLQEKLNQK